MATTKTTQSSERRDSSGRSLKQRSMPFVGLFLLPIPAYALGLVLHYAVDDPSHLGVTLTAVGITALTCALCVVAYAVSTHRANNPAIRWMVIVTIAVAGLAEAITVAVGLERWWTTTFLAVGEGFAGAWCLTRIDAFRKDPKQDQGEPDPLTKKLGLDNTKFGRAKAYTDETGDVTRIEVPVQHGPGETAEVIQHAVPGIESVADQSLGGGVPRGRSRAVPTDGAGRSTLVIITKDVLKALRPYPGPSSPGGCVTDPIVTGVYENTHLVKTFTAGGQPAAPTPASKGRMGMTRTGKTMNAQVEGCELISRRNVQMMWFDTIKGAQTVRPMRRGLDIIVANDDPREFVKGMKAIQELIKWRANELGKYGYRSWEPACATDPNLMMPFLVPHFEEADALTDVAGEEMIFIASKGLSTGVAMSISLQRADATSMPTGLRFNIGNWACFGCGDDYSAGFALSAQTIDAGAHPENWRQSKPGYFYTEGIGIDEQWWPVPAKSFFMTDEAMEAHCEIWGPRMQPLDRGSVGALGEWYARARRATVDKVAEWDAGPLASPVVHDGTAVEDPAPVSPAGPASTRADVDADRDVEQYEEIAAEVAAEIDEIGDELMRDGTYDEVDPEALRIDPGKPAAPVPAGPEVSWRSDKGEAPTREAAVDALIRALQEIADDPTSDPEEDEDDEAIRKLPDGAVAFSVGALAKRYTFRSRPWFSPVLADMARGAIPVPGLALEAGTEPGEYRLQRVAEAANSGHAP